ncbi:Abi family protein [Vibrio cholerae]
MQVDQAFINALEVTLSKSRLDTYRTYFSCQNDAEALGTYLWNKSLSTAFYPLLQATEITLRNSIHSAASAHFSGNKEWFLMKKFPSAKKEAEKQYLKKDRKTPITPRPSSDTVVASLSFGFWVNLLTQNYDDPVKNTKLWPTLIPQVFPNAKSTNATRTSLHHRFKFIKDFRNRVGHYEPIWKIRDTVDGGGNIIRLGPTTPEESIIRLNEYVDLIAESLMWMRFERYDFIVGMGIIDHIRQLCSLEALSHFQGTNPTKLKVNKLKHELSKRHKENGSVSGLYELTTSPKGVHKGRSIVLEVKQIYPPRMIK